MTPTLGSPLTLPCGVVLKNRLLKSAMSEALGTGRNDASPALETLYATWAAGGVGLQVTGNVMIDRTALGEPGNVVLDAGTDPAALRAWAQAATGNDTAAWVQLNHPGRQSPSLVSRAPVAPSAVPIGGAIGRAFRAPRALTAAEVVGLVGRFGEAAAQVKAAGFTGVQLHGAHGYLVSQFLSPLVNHRTDEWGGSPENRRRFALEVYRAMRAAVGSSFPVSIKLNSADFQEGGLSQEESMETVEALAAAGLDLIEISGGTYEAPAMAGMRRTTRDREAYFLDFAEKARARVKVPLAVTGGFRSGPAMVAALRSGAVDLIGLARPLAVCPDFPIRLLADPSVAIELPRPSTGIKALDRAAMLSITYFEAQLARMGNGQPPDPSMSAWRSILGTVSRAGLAAFGPRRA